MGHSSLVCTFLSPHRLPYFSISFFQNTFSSAFSHSSSGHRPNASLRLPAPTCPVKSSPNDTVSHPEMQTLSTVIITHLTKSFFHSDRYFTHMQSTLIIHVLNNYPYTISPTICTMLEQPETTTSPSSSSTWALIPSAYLPIYSLTSAISLR